MIGVGQTFGNYKVVSKLGQGGMGTVYLAEHPLIGKKVALKVIHPELARSREVVMRFFNEARAVNQIGNDHIVDISDFGQTAEGEYFFIMEYLAGKSLAEVLAKESPLATQRALRIATQIAEALAASHQVGVIHRDLKPDNVHLINKLGETEFVKLLDFGLAKLVTEGGAHLTRQGVVLGTPQYMSPEQCESRGNVDHRTDVYSLGILLYQMVAGVLPFDGSSMGEVLVKHVGQPVPPPRGYNPQIPPSVEQVILKALSKRAAERFQNMGEFRSAIIDPDRWMLAAMPGARSSGQIAAPTADDAPTNPGGPPGMAVKTMFDQGPTAVGNPAGFGAAPVTAPMQAQPQPVKTMLADPGMLPLRAAPPPTMAMASPPPMAPPPALVQMSAPASPSTVVLAPEHAAGVRRSAVKRKNSGVVIGISLALVGAAVAAVVLVAFREKAQPAAAAAAPTKPTPPKPVKPKEPEVKPTPPPDPPKPTMVKVAMVSEPKGADIIDIVSGKKIGVTPMDLVLEQGKEREVAFRLAGYQEKKKIIKAMADTEVSVVLDRAAGTGKRPPKKKNDDELLKPKGGGEDILEPSL